MNTPEDDFTRKAQPAFSGGPPQPPKKTMAGLSDDPDDADHQIYKSFLKERGPINKLRESESAKVGHDVGFEKALKIWIGGYRKKWLEENR